MFSLFKKSKIPKKEPELLNVALINELYLIMNYDLLRIINDPVNKLYILNTYTNSYRDLEENISTQLSNRTLTAVNIYTYCKHFPQNYNDALKRIIKYLQSNKIASRVEHDFYELINAFKELKGE